MSLTNWYVLTGGPSSGKTKVLEKLSFLGYRTLPESARIVIDDYLSKGKTLEEIRSDDQFFNDMVLECNLLAQSRMQFDELVFLDRSIIDNLAYAHVNGLDESKVRGNSKKDFYKGVFFFHQLPFMKDEARIEDDAWAKRISDEIRVVYSELEYRIIDVPVLPIAERVDLILDNITI